MNYLYQQVIFYVSVNFFVMHVYYILLCSEQILVSCPNEFVPTAVYCNLDFFLPFCFEIRLKTAFKLQGKRYPSNENFSKLNTDLNKKTLSLLMKIGKKSNLLLDSILHFNRRHVDINCIFTIFTCEGGRSNSFPRMK